MDMILLRKEIMGFEGLRTKVYLDTLGLPTVGVGHMDKKLVVGATVSMEQINKWFADDIDNSIAIASKSCKNYNQLDEVRQRVLIQLAFNLGNKLLQFKKMLAAIEKLDWVLASKELENSKWYTQVGVRAPKTKAAMLTGQYPK